MVKSTHSDLLIVTAVNEEESEYNGQKATRKLITFVLDSSTSGVTFNEISDTIGCTEVPFGTIEFSNVRLNGGNLEIAHDCAISSTLISIS